MSVQISLAVGPSVPGGQGQKGDREDGQGYSSDIGARGGVAAGIDKYYVSRVIPVLVGCLSAEYLLSLTTDAMSTVYVPTGHTTGA
jgi:hypothetical protein